MEGSETLVLVFLDEDNNESSISIKDPDMDLSLEDVTEAMEKIIENDAVLTAAGKHLEQVRNCYYRVVTITFPESEEGE